MPSFQKVAGELVTAFDGKLDSGVSIQNSPYFDDYVAMATALSEGVLNEDIKRAFLQLEQDMIASTGYYYNAANRAKSHFDQQKKHFDAPKSAPVQVKPVDNNAKKLLTKALGKFERTHGFVVPDRLPNYAGFVFGHVFTEGLAAKMHWKDVGAGAEHGEFTHRIQWYLLIQANIIKTVPKGQEANVYASIAPWQKGKTNLWTFLFDRAKAVSDGDGDFRCPEYLNLWLTGDTSPDFCPLLRSFLKARMSKRGKFRIHEYVMAKTGMTEEEVDAIMPIFGEDGWYSSVRIEYGLDGNGGIRNFATGRAVPRPPR